MEEGGCEDRMPYINFRCKIWSRKCRRFTEDDEFAERKKQLPDRRKGANLVVLNAALSLAEGRGCPTGVKRYGAVLLLPGWYELVRSDTALYACILK